MSLSKQSVHAYFEANFKSLYPVLVAFGNKIVRDLPASEDIVQELYVYFFEKKERVTADNPKSYLFKAMHNRCQSHLRKQISFQRYVSENGAGNQADYNTLLEEAEFESYLHQQIQQLPKRCREIFVLSRFHDQSNEQIAEQLHISKRTVETQISKALKILRQSVHPTFFSIFLI